LFRGGLFTEEPRRASQIPIYPSYATLSTSSTITDSRPENELFDFEQPTARFGAVHEDRVPIRQPAYTTGECEDVFRERHETAEFEECVDNDRYQEANECYDEQEEWVSRILLVKWIK
jgi:hypothetical protein